MKSYKTSNPGQPFSFSRTEQKIANRTVLAAMTNKQSYDNGIISEEEIMWLAERAKGGFGIITTAATNVSAEGQGWEGEFGVYDDIHIADLEKLTTTIHQTDSIILAQLFHGGIRSPQKLTGVVPVSASELSCDESETGKCRSASEHDIDNIINNFTKAAMRCVKSGFDGIELHGAHGYLISQFLGTKTNLRQDNWGGDLEKRVLRGGNHTYPSHVAMSSSRTDTPPFVTTDHMGFRVVSHNIDGDINNDGSVDVLDIVFAVNIVLSNEYNSSADLNLDNTVDVLDIVQLVNIILN